MIVPYLGYLVVLFVLAVPLGTYMAHVMDGQKCFLSPVIAPLERGTYKLLHIDSEEQMSWKRYLAAVLMFSGIGLVFLTALQMLQNFLPANPQNLPNVSWDLAFNTASSFVTNTNWQAYSGETVLSYLSQFLGLTVQNFVSAATGIAVLFALIRGFRETKGEGLGSFWTDMVRIILYVLIPLNLVTSLCLAGSGVVQNFSPSATADLLEPVALDAEGEQIEGATIDGTTVRDADGNVVADATVVDKQFLPQGPAASQISIKQSGTNGGGFYGANSSVPYENPNAFTNLIESISLLVIPAACCFTFGINVRHKKQGVAIFAAMAILLVAFLAIVAVNEQAGTPQLGADGQVSLEASAGYPGGNMEGKESRFGIDDSSVWATYTTAASNGSVNSMHDSYTPLGGLVTMLQMELGEVIFGGTGCGLYGMIGFAILTVFIAGLMVGRTPEFLGKKIEPYEMRMAVIVCLATPLVILVGSGIAAVVPGVIDSVNSANAGGPHGFSELLYAFSSAGGNNGSAFAGFNANTPFLNVTLGLVMLGARFLPIFATLAIAGSLSRKKMVATTAGTLATDNALFVFLLIFIVLLIGALSFFPALALGPIAEFFQMIA